MKAIMYPAITLDGFISDLNGECYSWISEEDEEGYNQAIANAGCVLVGRKTYEQYKDDFPPKSGATVFVYTSRTDQQDQDKIKFLRGTPQETIEQISEYGFSEVIVGGGGEVNGALAEAGLIDEIIVSIYNITLGEGIPLFGSHKPKLRLKLLATTQEIEGIVKNHYEVNSNNSYYFIHGN
ncbi:MAG TPA: dihydrofolate reductase family protein [Patescibacteria group bacterium]|nr:dihydrofolate reductase family protein [Patescibacteria group bacterium]